MAAYGTFYRVNNGKTQTPAIAALQVASKEVWGSTPKNGGMEPTVQAYAGSLHTRHGIEFTTDIAPYSSCNPLDAKWYLNQTPGVLLRYDAAGNEYAAITADIHLVQP